MSDNTKSPHKETRGLNRHGLLDASALTGAAALVDASTLGSAVADREARVTGRDERNKAEVTPGELDEYHGSWNDGHSGEVRMLGVPSVRELMRIPVFNVDLAAGWGLINGSKRVLDDGAHFLNGNCYHSHISMTDGKYDDKYLFINDKANSRVVRIRLNTMKCDYIIIIPNVQAIHGLRLQRVLYARYVFCNAEFIVPRSSDGSTFDLSGDDAFALYNTIDAETMGVAWQVIVDGNPDSTDMDYSDRFVASACHSSEKAIDLGGMMHNKRDWMVVFDIPHIEVGIKAKHFVTLGDSKVSVIGGRHKDGRDSPAVRYIPVPRNPHGLNTSPDGKYFATNDRLSPTCIMIATEHLDDPFTGKLADPRDVVVGEPELGFGSLHTTFDGRGSAYTTLFIDSQLTKWNLADTVRAYKGEKVDYARQKFDTQYQSGHNHVTLCETNEADDKRIVMLNKFSKNRFLPAGPLYPENDQLIGISDEEIKLVHDGPTFAGPHDYILVRRDQIKIRKAWGRKDLFFAETVRRVEKDGIDLMKGNEVVHEGNKVRVYMVSMAPSFSLIEFKVKQDDEVTVTITNLDEIEDMAHGFIMINHGAYMEISPQQTSSITLVADKPGVHWCYCSWFCHALHMEIYGWMLVEKAWSTQRGR